MHACETGLQQGERGLHVEVCSQVTSDQIVTLVPEAPTVIVEALEGAPLSVGS